MFLVFSIVICKNKEEAFKMLSSLSNREHQVITGISIINLDNNKKIIDYVVSNVKFKNLTEQDIKDKNLHFH